MRNLYIVRGIPGSGKSTFAKKLAELNSHTVFMEHDQFMYEDGVYKWTEEKMRQADDNIFFLTKWVMEGGALDIVVADAYTTLAEFENLKTLAKLHNYMITVIVVENHHGGKDIHNVPADVLEDMRKNFEIKL